MPREEFEVLESGVMKRKSRRIMGLFIDAGGLDRATRRLERKVDIGALVAGLSSGLKIEIARYYCLIPYEDDARQLAYLEAVEKAGIEVLVKRLPPKGVKRMVSMDVHIACDLLRFAFDCFNPDTKKSDSEKSDTEKIVSVDTTDPLPPSKQSKIKKLATCVCPSRELGYALSQCRKLGVEISLADFGLYATSDTWEGGVDNWVDLSTSETIWRV
jgi:hypothetical protein